jgi:DNA topoisomerase-1
MTELIITEKPSAAKKVANGIASQPKEHTERGVTYYEIIQDDGTVVYVASAVGHIFTLEEKEKGFEYPTFDIEWIPSYEADDDAKYTKKFYRVLNKLSKEADTFTLACDYDVEGEVIGYNVLRYICEQPDANRMKFSTLTPSDVQDAYENKDDHIDWGQAKAGETRHHLDWMYGINLSRALTKAMKRAGRFTMMSSGRVQSPALKIVADKEKEIQSFEPTPYWLVKADIEADNETTTINYDDNKVWDEDKAQDIVSTCADAHIATVDDIDERYWKQSPPNPFNLSTLQSEAYKTLNISPKQTLQIAQDLYTAGYTSYPRTGSEKLPKSIGYEDILDDLADNNKYKSLVNNLLNEPSLKPNNGSKDDPAHPAIYPTGEKPSGLSKKQQKVYDLIARRFLATFGNPATRKTTTITFDIEDHAFNTKATKTVKDGWHQYYTPYLRYKEQEISDLDDGQHVSLLDTYAEEKETKPPRRYTKASLVKELEKQELGTKATRANIVENLFDRGYVDGKSLEATELGLKLATTLEEHIPEIVSPELTQQFEDAMEDIRAQEKDPDDVLSEAKGTLLTILETFKEDEKTIGEALLESHEAMMKRKNTLGPCPNCDDGELMKKDGKYGAFAACNNYPDCETTFSLPDDAKIVPTDEVSDTGHPMVKVIQKGKSPQTISVNPDDNMSDDIKTFLSKVESGNIEIYDDESGSKMVVREGPYGKFLGAEDYPDVKKIIDPEDIIDDYRDQL